jgi:hypothetical protein
MGAHININTRKKIRINLSMEVSTLKANYDKLVMKKVFFN